MLMSPGEGAERKRVALVYDDQTRPETTGTYCRRALEKLAEVTFFHPSKLAEVPRSGFDLYLNIDDGMRYPWPAELRPCAWWAIDTHMDFGWCLEKARGFDFIFAAQRDGAALLRQEGIASAQWLPLACDADIHARQDVAKQFDVCFVGNLMPGPRVDLVRLIQQHFKNVYVGQAYFEEMAKIYSAARIVFNRSVKNDVNMRVFETLASGSLLLTNDLTDNGQAELFRDGVQLATYRDGNDLLDKLRYYLQRDDVREKIAAAGREEVLAKHTYRHRMEEVLRVTGNCKFRIENCKSRIDKTSDKQDLSYFDFGRPEVLELIPSTACRVLEIGCGTGRLGEALKKRQNCQVVGIELNHGAAGQATARLDRVIVGNVEQLTLDFADGSFDCLVCADVLEHLVDPAAFLRRARRWLADDGVLIASIPNVRHHSVVGSLIDGNWTYEPAGLLDDTHLHFFTRHDAQELFVNAGYQVEALQFVPGPGYDEWQRQGDKTQVQVGSVCLTGVPPQEAEEFFVYQFLVVAKSVVKRDSVDRSHCERNVAPLAKILSSESVPSRNVHSLAEQAGYVDRSLRDCDRPAKEWYLQQIKVPLERLTFSNIFVNANYRRFQRLDTSDMAVVASEGGDYWVPEDVMNSDFDLDRLVERLLAVDRPILVSAGPASCVIIHKYWQRAVKKQVIVDVGSAIGERSEGRKTRQYQTPGTRTAELICRWA